MFIFALGFVSVLDCFADVRLCALGSCFGSVCTIYAFFAGLSAFFVFGFFISGSELLRTLMEERLCSFGIAGTGTVRPPPCTMGAFSKSMLPPHEAAVVVGPHICIANLSLWFTTNESSVLSVAGVDLANAII